MRGVDEAGGGDDGGAVLVVVEDRDVHQLAQALLDDEALGRLDVLQIDPAEGGAEEAHRVDELVRVLGVDAEVHAVDIGEALEEGDLAFHHRLGGERAEVAQAQHRRAVRDHRHEIALGGVVVGERRIAVDVQAGLGDAGRVGEGQVARRGQRLGEAGLQLAGPARGVHRQRLFGRGAGGAVVHDGFGRGGRRVAMFIVETFLGSFLGGVEGAAVPVVASARQFCSPGGLREAVTRACRSGCSGRAFRAAFSGTRLFPGRCVLV